MSGDLCSIKFNLNGTPVAAAVAPHHTLVEMLRSSFGLFGARESCGQGMCGCCTVIVNGLAVSGCLHLAVLVDNAEVCTIEAVADGGRLSEVQQAFIECGAFQCGFCTSGFILMAEQLLQENLDPTEDQIRDYLCGNLCRCATYPEIIRAVKFAAQKRKDALLDVTSGDRLASV